MEEVTAVESFGPSAVLDVVALAHRISGNRRGEQVLPTAVLGIQEPAISDLSADHAADPQSEEAGKIQLISVAKVRLPEHQPRKRFDPEALKFLGRSLLTRQVVPIIVYPINDPEFHFGLTDGHRRLKAAIASGQTSIWAWIRPAQDEKQQLLDTFTANCCHEDYTPLEKAAVIGELRQMGLSTAEVALACGFSEMWVRCHLDLLKLDETTKEHLNQGSISVDTAWRLGSIKDLDRRHRTAEEIITRKIPSGKAITLILQKRAESMASGSYARNRMAYLTHFVRRLSMESAQISEMTEESIREMVAGQPETLTQDLIYGIKAAITRLQRLALKIQLAQQNKSV